jgi:surfeit locus 1 family protein
MPFRTTLFCLFAALAAAIFIRLGLWQISRLHERRALNAVIAVQQHSAPVPLDALPRDTSAHYRPAMVSGQFDYDHELVLTNRTRRGSPGVELLTPVRVAGSDTAVLVDRGWVYAPDGSTVDRTRWREHDSATVSGYVELYTPDGGTAALAKDPHIVRHASRQQITARLPYPIAPFYLVLVGGHDSASAAHPARRDLPVLDDGPHRSYAVQWFSFAAIALGGAAAVVRRERMGAGLRA